MSQGTCNVGRLLFGLAWGVLALAGAHPAEAEVIAYSSLVIDNFLANTGITGANLSYPNGSDAELSDVPGFGNHRFNSDAPMSCSGTCDGIGENDFTGVAFRAPGNAQTFARGDSLVDLVFHNMHLGVPVYTVTSSTVAEFNMLNFANGDCGRSTLLCGNADGQVGYLGSFFFGFGDWSVGFDATGTLMAISNDAGGSAAAAFSWVLTVVDPDTETTVAQFAPSALNQNVDVSGIGNDIDVVEDHFTFDVGLLTAHTYQLYVGQQSTVSGSLDEATPQPSPVPEPTSLALLGPALLGFWALSRCRKAA
ncbi:MAG TPA: EDSAP-1 family PEP-CTERM protein [Stellaceae bacterium]|nr:EDSAP-1 family PEP-CTERM protein [Stellaceae bacterium]